MRNHLAAYQQVWGNPKLKEQPNWKVEISFSPEGASVNDGILKELCSLQYMSLWMLF